MYAKTNLLIQIIAVIDARNVILIDVKDAIMQTKFEHLKNLVSFHNNSFLKIKIIKLYKLTYNFNLL